MATEKELAAEIVKVLNNLEPNKVFTLSKDAGKYLLKTIKEMQEKGEI